MKKNTDRHLQPHTPNEPSIEPHLSLGWWRLRDGVVDVFDVLSDRRIVHYAESGWTYIEISLLIMKEKG
jgi:hypothetical protein